MNVDRRVLEELDRLLAKQERIIFKVEETAYQKRARERAEKVASEAKARKELDEANDIRFWDLQDEHGKDKIDRLICRDGTMIVVKVDPDEYKRMKQSIQRKSKQDGSAVEAFAYNSVIEPADKLKLDVILGKYPGQITAIANTALALAGTLDEAEGKA